MRLRYKLPIAFAVTTLVFAGIVALVAALALRGVSLDRLESDMSLQARQFAAVLEQETSTSASGDAGYLQALTDKAGDAGDVRLTVVAHDGTVLADSQVDPATLGNHSDRPEVAQALAGHEGRARRHSSTLGQEEAYVAVPLPTGDSPWASGVVRTALPASRVDAMVAASWRVPLIVWAVLLLPTLAIAFLLSRTITKPVQRLRDMTGRVAGGDLAYRTSVRRSDELGALAESLNTMASQLQTQVEQLATEKERSARVLTSMTEGVVVISADGLLVRANPAAARILRAPLEGAEGKPLVVTVRAFPAQALAEKSRRAAAPVGDIVELPGQRYVAVEVIPLQTAAGQGAETGQTLFVIRDETARLTTDRIRRDFATNVSHELKTPLAGLSLLADTLKHALHEDPEQAAIFVDRLSAEIGRLTDLTTDLLTLSKLEEPGGAATERQERLDLGRLATETAAELHPPAEAKQQQVTVDTEAGALVLGDEVALRTLIRNLLDNAIRYTEPGGHIAMRVATEAGARGAGGGGGGGGRTVVLTVQDDGAGIPAADQSRIFERFYRVDKARSRETGGTGLGLSIVRHVAERHGGTVEVASTLGTGSTFTVRLPAAE